MNLQYSGRAWPKSRVSEQAWTRLFRSEALAKQDGRCTYCAEPMRAALATADHVMPKSRGGATVRENIKAACEACNVAKSNMSAAQFLKKIKHPESGDPIGIWMAWARRKIWLATHRSCDRIARSVT